MESLAAVGLASNILQFVEFAGKLISQSKEIYHSADGTLNTYTVLEEAAENLTELSRGLNDEDLTSRKLGSGRSGAQDVHDKQLIRLREESREITLEMLRTISKFKAKPGSSALRSVGQALRTIWNEKEIKALETRLYNIRQQIDTALLFSLRTQVMKSSKDSKDEMREGLTQLSKENEQKHIELLNAIKTSNAYPTDAKNIPQISDHIRSVAQEDSALRFLRIVSARLRFAELPDRFESIPEAHKNTFSWIFHAPPSLSSGYPWTSFIEWLQNNDGHNIYWITGKPGSGKSTLMKYLYQDKRTMSYLRNWSGSAPLICSGFFFWNSGTVMQMSRLGLLQTLLFLALRQVLKTDDNLSYARWLFQERWEQFEAFGGGRNIFTWLELRRTFERLISDTSKNFFFVIDGLDEFDGDAKELNELIISASRRSNVKICTASRPWLVFEEAFEDRPSLLLEQLTNDDIHTYITSKFEANKRYGRLKQQDPIRSQRLVQDIAQKAAGVFLWVYLVVESLLQGIINADSMSDLQARLDALPSDLEALFDKLLRKMEPDYYRQGCQYFRMLNDHVYPPLLCLAFADDDDVHSSLAAEVQKLSAAELQDKVETIERRLKSRCMGLLEIFEPKESDDGTDEGRAVHFRASILEQGAEIVVKPTEPEELKVRYLHRTARDFLQSPPIWARILEATGNSDFDTTARWANGFLWALKTSPSVRHRKTRGKVPDHVKFSMSFPMRLLFTWCLEYALRLEKRNERVQVAYLDEVGRAIFHGRKKFHLDTYDGPITSFIKMAIIYGLGSYVQIKMGKISKDEANHIAGFVVEISDRVPPVYVRERLSPRDMLIDSMRDRKLLKDQLGLHGPFRKTPYPVI